MNKTTKGLVLTLLSALLAVSQQAWGQTDKQTLFATSSDGTYIYRIPSIVRLPNGNLWAMCDLRWGKNASDIGGGYDTPHRIDVVGKLSTDNGLTWGNQQDIAKGNDNVTDNDENGYDYAHGDPASVVDRESGKILVMSASGRHGFFGSSKLQVARSLSADGGQTWTISNISDKLYQNDSYVAHCFFSSGRIIQSTLVKKGQYYRLYAAVNTRNVAANTVNGKNGCKVVYSDDFGETWTYLGGIESVPSSTGSTFGDESKVEELPNGNILLSCRALSTGRIFNIFTFTDRDNAQGSWSSPVYNNSTITAASCDEEILLVPAKDKSGNQVYVLLQSAAMSSERKNVGIYYKVLSSTADYDQPSDFNSGWTKYAISTTTSCYATMVLNKDGDIAFLYEENKKTFNGEAYDIQYMTLPLSTITGGAYTYSPNTATNGYHVTSEPSSSPVEIATPTFSVTSGTYTSAQQVEITSTDANVTIYYTTDGTEPTTGSTKYTGAITVDHDMTLKAIAVNNDDNSYVSQVATATYKVQIPDVLLPEAPTFSVASGTYTSELTVELKTATDGTTIYYTTDGSEPSENSSKYESAITVDKSTVIKAIAVDGEGNKSTVSSAQYSIVSASEVTKIGTTISLDYGSSHRLFSSKASGDASNPDNQYFGFLRHDVAHVQIITSNDATLSTGGDEVFNENDNDMLFEKVGDDTYLSFNSSSKSQYVYAQVVAPKGYRIMRYQMAFDADNSTSGSSVMQYTYDSDGKVVEGTSANVSDGTWDQTLANGSNMLFFRFDATAVSSKVMVKSIHITYAIDQPITGQVPNENGEPYLHTGLLDLGTFSKNTKGFWSFSSSAVTDQQQVTLVNSKGEEQTETYKVGDDQYFVAATDSDYYLEAPEKFRIVGATLQLLRHSSDYTTSSHYEDVTTVDDGEYIITDGNGHYLNLNGSSLATGTNVKTATVWTLTGQGNDKYQIKSGSYYLVLTISNNSITGVTASTSATYGNWIWDTSYQCFKASSSSSSPGYLSYVNSGWNVSNNTSDKSKLQKEVPSTTATRPASDFTATVYDREGKATSGTATVTSTNSEATLTVDDYNNDAIRFKISGLASGSAALYRVNLKFLPLNPEVQTLQVAAKYNGGVIGSNEVTSTNYTFHGGEAVRVLVPKDAQSPYTLVFRKAENEEKTLWYSEGVNNNDLSSTGGYSNFTLVGSTAYDGDKGIDMTATPWPTARVNADQAGTNKLLATNISDVVDEKASTLQDRKYKKGDGGLQAVSLENGTEQTVYVYSADMPTWSILPTGIGSGKRHIDYRFYTIKVMPVVENEKPDVTLTPVYTQTLKAKPHKDGSTLKTDGGTLDTKHTYVGVTVKSTTTDGTTPYGVLTNTEIISAIKGKLAENNYYGFDEADPLRSILYVDMSALNTVTGEATEGENNWDAFNAGTADNCLYFMPVGFTRNVENTISKRQDGKFEAVGNIRLHDQQPFFTPYAFTTGTRQAIYNRESTATDDGNVKAMVKNMTTVLPFSLKLTPDGHLKTATDATDNSVQFHDITGYGEVTAVSKDDPHQELTYAMVAEAVTSGKAEANQPYYVTSTTPGFTFNILGAQFEKTPGTSSNAIDEGLQRTQGNWTAIGTYAGSQPKAGASGGKGKWYFSKDLFWNAAQLPPKIDHFNARPFRAYYYTTDNSPAAQTEEKAKVVFNPADVTPTGIRDISATEGNLVVTVGHGSMTLTATAATRFAIYTVGGQLVARGQLAQGASHTISVPAGVYVVNNQKVVVK